jgi:hypothetical protein
MTILLGKKIVFRTDTMQISNKLGLFISGECPVLASNEPPDH